VVKPNSRVSNHSLNCLRTDRMISWKMKRDWKNIPAPFLLFKLEFDFEHGLAFLHRFAMFDENTHNLAIRRSLDLVEKFHSLHDADWVTSLYHVTWFNKRWLSWT